VLPIKIEQPVPVFIVHWNRPWECIRAVQCFLEQDLPVNVTVVDNASDFSSFETLRVNFPSNVELVRLDRNKGWGGGLNVLLKRWLSMGKGDFCFVSAHDALPQNKCLRMLLESIQNDPNIGVVCPEYGIAQLLRFSPVRGARLVPTSPRPFGTVEPVDFPHGTLMLLRRQCLEEIDVFDERYFSYGEETEIGPRAWRHGWKVAIVWGAIVVNPGSWTPKPIFTYLWARNSLFMARAYGGWSSALLRAFLMVVNTIRVCLSPTDPEHDFFVSARLLAIRDFLLGKDGPPSLQFQHKIICEQERLD